MVPFKVYTSFSHLFNSGRGGGEVWASNIEVWPCLRPCKNSKIPFFFKTDTEYLNTEPCSRRFCYVCVKEVAIKMVDKKQMNATGMAGRVRQEVVFPLKPDHM